MKTRNGFVSNSSTSSFVLVGFFVDANQYTVEDLVKLLDCGYKRTNKDIRVIDSDYYGKGENGEEGPVPEGKLLVSFEVSDIDYEGNRVIPITSGITKLKSLQEKLNISEAEFVLFHHLNNS